MVASLRIAVIGVGHLGRHHARLLAELDEAELVAVVDADEARAAKVAAAHGTAGVADYRELAGRVDAVTVVTPTGLHREVAAFFLERGVDVFVEKPIASTLADGEALVAAAAEHGRILQVGHVERFNPALRSIAHQEIVPRYIEAQRLAPFTFRSVDIGVVLDLMIHDIDLVLHLIGSPVVSVEAFGGAVFTRHEDLAIATLRFENGAVAQLTANRVALKPMRRMRLFGPESYASLDFHAAKGTVIRKQPGWEFGELDVEAVDPGAIPDLWKFVFEGLLAIQEYTLDEGNPLRDELVEFLRACRERSRPPVTGEEGCQAVAIAEQIREAVQRNRW